MKRNVITIFIIIVMVGMSASYLTIRYKDRTIRVVREESLRRELIMLMEIVNMNYDIAGIEHHSVISKFIDISSRKGTPRYIFRALNHEKVSSLALSSGKEQPIEYSFQYPEDEWPTEGYSCGVRPLYNKEICYSCHGSKRRVLGTAEVCVSIDVLGQ